MSHKKFEIELDVARIHDDVVKALLDKLTWEAREHASKAVRDEILAAVRRAAREHMDSIMQNYTLPDGRTFRQYVDALLTTPANDERRIPWNERPKLIQLAEERLWRETERLFADVARPHIDELKAKLRDSLVNRILDAK